MQNLMFKRRYGRFLLLYIKTNSLKRSIYCFTHKTQELDKMTKEEIYENINLYSNYSIIAASEPVIDTSTFIPKFRIRFSDPSVTVLEKSEIEYMFSEIFFDKH